MDDRSDTARALSEATAAGGLFAFAVTAAAFVLNHVVPRRRRS
jgi:hypothetical protein